MHYGLIPEFIGRLPVMSAVHQLTHDDLVAILTEPRNALVKQFQRFFSFDGIELVFSDDALVAVAEKALERETGARGLRSIIEEVLLEVQFELPSRRDVKKCVVTRETIEKGLTPTLVTEAVAGRGVRRLPARASKKRAEAARAGARGRAGSLRRPRCPLHASIEDLAARTRFEPAEVEPRLIAQWLQSGMFHPEPLGSARRELLDRDPAAERDRRAAHGPRLRRHDPGRADPPGPHARAAHEVDLRHRPCGHRDADAGRTPADREGTTREELGREAFVERTWRWREQYGSTIVEQYKRLGASCDYEDERFTLDPGYADAVVQRLRRALQAGPDPPRQLPRQLGSRQRLGDLRPRGRGARGDRHALQHRLPARGRRRRDRRRHGAPGDDAGRRRRRRAPRRSALRRARRPRGRSCRSSGAGCRSSPTPTSSPSSAPAR